MAEFAVVKFSLLAVTDTRQTGFLREAEGGLPSAESRKSRKSRIARKSQEELVEGLMGEPSGGSVWRASFSLFFSLASLILCRVQEAVRAEIPVGCVKREQFAVG